MVKLSVFAFSVRVWCAKTKGLMTEVAGVPPGVAIPLRLAFADLHPDSTCTATGVFQYKGIWYYCELTADDKRCHFTELNGRPFFLGSGFVRKVV